MLPALAGRWDQASGSIDVVYGFTEPVSGDTPEAAALSFLERHSALFGLGVADDLAQNSRFSREALGGYLLRFDQVYQGLPVIEAGVGLVLDGVGNVRTVTTDVFPTSPPITAALKDSGALLDANGEEIKRPLGQVRVEPHKFDESNAATGTEGPLTGDHALITNALPTRLPFGQAATGTYHFDRDELPLKGRTDKVDHLKEPAEHQDAISQFFYITSFIEYLGLPFTHKPQQDNITYHPSVNTRRSYTETRYSPAIVIDARRRIMFSTQVASYCGD